MKRCTKCGESKSLASFALARGKPSGFKSHCKLCVSSRNHEPNPDIRSLICNKCGEEKPSDDFYRDRRAKTGYGSWCKHCLRVVGKSRNHAPNPHIEGKDCAECGEYKVIEDFNLCRKYKDGYDRRCKLCNVSRYHERMRCLEKRRSVRLNSRAYWLKAKYGLTVEHYNAIHESQGGRCAIDGCTNDATVVDHCHETGLIRGLLCLPCNVSIGALGENVRRIFGIANYLIRSRKSEQTAV